MTDSLAEASEAARDETEGRGEVEAANETRLWLAGHGLGRVAGSLFISQTRLVAGSTSFCLQQQHEFFYLDFVFHTQPILIFSPRHPFREPFRDLKGALSHHESLRVSSAYPLSSQSRLSNNNHQQATPRPACPAAGCATEITFSAPSWGLLLCSALHVRALGCVLALSSSGLPPSPPPLPFTAIAVCLLPGATRNRLERHTLPGA